MPIKIPRINPIAQHKAKRKNEEKRKSQQGRKSRGGILDILGEIMAVNYMSLSGSRFFLFR